LLAGAAAVLLGIVGGLWLTPGRDRDEPAVAERSERADASSESRAADPAAIPSSGAGGAYRSPEAASVERALTSVRTDYAQGGASAVAGQARACFDSLARTPGYAELDYCLAYDAYGAALARRLAQGQPLPAGSWFAETETRALRVAQSVIGEQGDAAARLLDIRRLTVAAAADNPAQRTQTATAPQAPPTERAVPPERAAPRPTEVAAADQAPRRSEPARPAPEPRPREPLSTPVLAPVQRVAVEPIAPRARPSFNCRYARSPSERLVCSDPVLAAADWRLHNAFEQAKVSGADPRALRAEQDRWLAARDAAAPDPRAVLQVYETRIDELAALY
jgi:hypothetical protein